MSEPPQPNAVMVVPVAQVIESLRTDYRDAIGALQTDYRDAIGTLRVDMGNAFGRLEKAVDGKADKGDIQRIETTLHQHAAQLEEHREQIDEIKSKQRAEDAADVAVETVTKKRHDHLMRRWAAWTAAGAVSLPLLTWLIFAATHGK